ncbi:MAG TPA: C40 family peptidase [Candidatus Paceibacterota bacterium]
MAVNGQQIADYAKQYIGTPYVWGGNSLQSGVDCSGLVQQVYKKFGLSVPRVTYDQIGTGKAVKMDGLQVGDMIFFDFGGKSGPDHVGIYLGDGKFIHAPRPGKGVEISDLKSGYYQDTFVGGRRVSGIQGGGPSGEWDPSGGTAEAKLSPEELAAEYGFAYSFLQSVPELKTKFGAMVNETWTKEKFFAEIRTTKWWQENSETQRQVQVMKNTDPATYEANLGATKLQVQQLAAEMGAVIPPAKLGKIASQVLETGLQEDGLRNVLGQYVTFTKGTLRGEAGAYANAMKKYAYEQGVTLDDQTVKNQAALVGRKLATDEDFKNQIVQQAVSAYPSYKDQLEAGQTMMDIANPYIQIMAQELSIIPDKITLNDPLIRGALNGVNADGKPMGMDQTTFLNRLRNDPRWGQTQDAQDKVMDVGYNVLKSMGLRG